MTTYYEKVGRRYKPVREEYAWSSLPSGAHLVVIKPGLASMAYNINPDDAGLIAAARMKRDKLREILMDAMAMKPSKRPITEAQKSAWEAFSKAMGGDRYCVQYDSVAGLIDKLIDAVIDGDEGQ